MEQQRWLVNLRYWWLRRQLAPESDATGHFCPRFGQLAVELGYVSKTQVRRALLEQWDDSRQGRPHRVLGAIFFANNWMTPGQIDRVLNELFRRRLAQERQLDAAAVCPLPYRSNS